jgi:hypothetical protein
VSTLLLPFSADSNASLSSSILFNISNASNIASFFVAAAFFNLSAERSSSGSALIISSFATFISCSTAL